MRELQVLSSIQKLVKELLNFFERPLSSQWFSVAPFSFPLHLSWIKFSLKNAGVIFIAMLMVIAGGIYSVKMMKMESMPSVDIPYIIVQVPYVGATPEQGLEDIGKPL